MYYLYDKKSKKSEIWNRAFLKWHDMSEFLDKPFLVSDGMGDLGDIVFQK